MSLVLDIDRCLPSAPLSRLLGSAPPGGWEKSGFVEAMVEYSEGLSVEVFHHLEEHLQVWAEGRWVTKQREKRK